MTDELERFFAKRPAVRLQYEQEGAFREYGRRLFHRVPLGRGARLTNRIVEYAQSLLHIEVDARLLRAQLNQYPLVSTADHAGVMHQGILYNANLLCSGLLDLQSLPYHLVLASTRIPMSNAAHPRGIVFQGQKLNFFSKRSAQIPVWLFEDGIRPEQAEDLGSLFSRETLAALTSDQKKFLEAVFTEAVDLKKIVQSNRLFVDQLTSINHKLWPHYFRKSFRWSRPVFLSFPIEALVQELLLEDLENSESLPSRILFDPRTREVYLEEFTGIVGGWSQGYGTQFFWGVDERRELIPLRVDQEGNTLQAVASPRGWEPVPLTASSVAAALREKRLVPSLFFEMLIVGFLEGYTLLGGFNQVTYMAWMRVAHERSMLRLGNWPMAAWFARTVTDGLICGPLPFPQWPSGFDLLWHFNSTNGRFHGNLDGGLDHQDLETVMDTPMKELLQNGVEAMLHVVD